VNGRVETAFRFPDAARRFQVPAMRRDRDGGLWIATSGGGLLHAHEGRIDVFPHADGLSNDSASAIFGDREGSISVTADRGLERFRELPVSAMSTREGLSNDRIISVLAGSDGGVWIGTFEGLNQWKDGVVSQITGPGLPEHGVQYLHEDHRGRLWIATGTGF